VEVPRSHEDYEVKADEAGMPAGVTLARMI
jgi:hypothetical protein